MEFSGNRTGLETAPLGPHDPSTIAVPLGDEAPEGEPRGAQRAVGFDEPPSTGPVEPEPESDGQPRFGDRRHEGRRHAGVVHELADLAGDGGKAADPLEI